MSVVAGQLQGASVWDAKVRLIGDGGDKALIDYLPVEVLASCSPTMKDQLSNFLQHLHDRNQLRPLGSLSQAECHELFSSLALDYLNLGCLGAMVVTVGDITKLEVDAIVNSANRSLLGGGGLNGAIHAAAGPGLLYECSTLSGCDAGDAKITGGHHLLAAHVIHTVGPVWSGGTANEDRVLARCYRRSLEVAEEHALRTVAFPGISTGAFGFPAKRAARIAIRTVSNFLDASSRIREVVFCCLTEKSADVHRDALAELERHEH